jgi:tripartite-type tricarboxylate transporter receptor subunit TctC
MRPTRRHGGAARRGEHIHEGHLMKTTGQATRRLTQATASRSRRTVLAIALATVGGWTLAATDTPYPERPVRLVVPYSPGGSSDQTARIVAEQLGRRLGQAVVVENRPGANGNIGTQEVANAKPDGHTLLLGFDGTLVVAPSVTKVPFDTLKSFQPVSLLVNTTLAIGAHPSVPANNFSELLAYSRKNPQALSYGTTGAGSTLHLGGELLTAQTGIQWTHVPYKGGAQALNDTLGGSTPLVYTALATLQQHVKSGRIKVIGLTGANRSTAMPEIPTLAETGAPGFDVSSWFGLLAPAGTPAPIVEKLNREVLAVMKEPAIRERFLSLSLEPAAGSPAQFTALMKADLARWKGVAERGNIKID